MTGTRWMRNAAIGMFAAVGGCATVLVGGVQGAAPAPLSTTALATSDIPPTYLLLYEAAAQRCPGLPWTVLAAVGKVESDHDRNPGPSPAGAVGPMQFEPATWTVYGVDGDSDGHRDPNDPADAIPAAADYLCALGASTGLPDALVAYTCGNSTPSCQAAAAGYVAAVLSWSTRYGTTVLDGPVAAGPAAQRAVAVALSQVGTPYVWGGEEPGGFDCSGLVQYSFAAAGIALPRVAQDQYDAGPLLPADASLVAGDLLFFGTSTTTIEHVGIYLGDGQMVDAPHTGALVRVEPVDLTDPSVVGVTRPDAASDVTEAQAPSGDTAKGGH